MLIKSVMLYLLVYVLIGDCSKKGKKILHIYIYMYKMKDLCHDLETKVKVISSWMSLSGDVDSELVDASENQKNNNWYSI